MQINKLYLAVDEKLHRQGLPNIIEGSLRSQIFGVFAENYKKWQESNMPADFTQYFAESDILSGRDMAVYRALLYFNLPQNIVFKPVKPIKVF